MLEALLVVLSRPLPGRDEDFNDWYSNIHIRDAMRFRGSVATQRFRLADHQIAGYHNPLGWKYLALYEVSDAARFTREHIEAIGTVRQQISDAFDVSVVNDYHYYFLQFRDNAPGETAEGGVILEQIKARAGHQAEFQRWYNDDYLPAAARRPGVKSGAFLTYRPVGQMLPTDPEFDFVAVYHLSDAAARHRWPGPTLLTASPLVEPAPLAITCWDVLIPRLTKDAVLHPTSELLACEERARARMGSRVHRGGAELLRER
jgi:hypothetical protein